MTLIRRAVGAIIQYKTQYILIHKVKLMELAETPREIEGEWDFVKGGVEQSDISLNETLFRELEEETGSIQYTILKKYPEKLRFQFSKQVEGLTHQETTMYLVKYIGHLRDLQPRDQEIDQIGVFSVNEVIEKLAHTETKQFFLNNILVKEK
ncbi:MAG: NUDIX hydrolase [Candidatus Heimdallarchaeota archaeon]|nr:NUDIX hydrolase [Candidatus Heimdallarchaeota archaeon]